MRTNTSESHSGKGTGQAMGKRHKTAIWGTWREKAAVEQAEWVKGAQGKDDTQKEVGSRYEEPVCQSGRSELSLWKSGANILRLVGEVDPMAVVFKRLIV